MAPRPPLVGASLLSRTATLTPADLRRRRDAVAALGDDLRQLVAAASLSEVAVGELLAAAAAVRAVTERLSEEARDLRTPASVDDFHEPVRMFNPVTGLGSAIAPPVVFTEIEGRLVGDAVLSPAHEGPFAHGHGGVVAMLMDQVVGQAAALGGQRGLTAQLDIRYRRPTPLQVPLRLEGWLEAVDGRKGWAVGTIATVAEPDVVLVEARGLMVTPSEVQVAAMFAEVTTELGPSAHRD